jgi:AcrR family transcriptional regulator
VSTPAEEALGLGEPRRGGRPRDPALDGVILDAALAVFADEGYAGVTIEAVAARAGVGKASIYRRYANKAELIVDAVRCGVGVEDLYPDTGDLRADLVAMMAPLVARLRRRDRVLLTFAVERVLNPELDAEFQRSVIGMKRLHIHRLVEAAVARGDLPAGTDLDLVSEVVPALIWHHALNDLPVSDDLVERAVDLFLP